MQRSGQNQLTDMFYLEHTLFWKTFVPTFKRKLQLRTCIPTGPQLGVVESLLPLKMSSPGYPDIGHARGPPSIETECWLLLLVAIYYLLFTIWLAHWLVTLPPPFYCFPFLVVVFYFPSNTWVIVLKKGNFPLYPLFHQAWESKIVQEGSAFDKRNWTAPICGSEDIPIFNWSVPVSTPRRLHSWYLPSWPL